MNSEMKVPGFVRSFVGTMERRPWLMLLAGILLLALLMPGMGRLEADFTYRGFFRESDPLLKRLDAFERRFGNDDAIVVAVHSPDGIFDKDSAQFLVELTERMWHVPDVIRVDSLSNYQWVHASGDDIEIEPFIPDDVELTDALLAERKAIALEHETIPDYLLSRDAKTALIFAPIKPGIDAPPDYQKIVLGLREITGELAKGDHELHFSGGPPLSYAFQEASQHDMQTLIPIVLLGVVVLLFVLLRSLLSMILSLVVVFTTIMGTMAVSGWLGVRITNVTSSLPQILIAIGIADSVHVLVTHLRALQRGKSRKEAASYALTKNFMPTILTSLTTAVGFFSFISAEVKPIAGLGLAAGLGAILAWLFTYLIMGPCLFFLPIRARKLSGEEIDKREGFGRGLADFFEGRRTVVIAMFSVLTAAALYMTTQNDVNSDPFKYFQSSVPVRIANEFIEAEVGGARGVELEIDTGEEEGIKDPDFLAKVDAYQKWIEQLPGITRVVSIVDVLKHTNRSLNGGRDEEFKLPTDRETVAQQLFLYTMSLPQGMDINNRVALKNDALRMTVLNTIPTSREAVATIEKIEAKGKEMGLAVGATGKYLLWQYLNGYVVKAFITSFTIAVFLISIILIIYFRSVKLGTLALLPNFIPIIAGGAVLYLMGQPLDVGTVIVASTCLGIAVDDTIHIMANFNRLLNEGKSSKIAVQQVMNHTGPALMVTTAILVIAFGTFAFATFTPNLWFGVLTASVLSIALFADLTFLPTLLLGVKRK